MSDNLIMELVELDPDTFTPVKGGGRCIIQVEEFRAAYPFETKLGVYGKMIGGNEAGSKLFGMDRKGDRK